MTDIEDVKIIAKQKGKIFFDTLTYDENIKLDLAIRLTYENAYIDGHKDGYSDCKQDVEDFRPLILEMQKTIDEKNIQIKELYEELQKVKQENVNLKTKIKQNNDEIPSPSEFHNKEYDDLGVN